MIGRSSGQVFEFEIPNKGIVIPAGTIFETDYMAGDAIEILSWPSAGVGMRLVSRSKNRGEKKATNNLTFWPKPGQRVTTGLMGEFKVQLAVDSQSLTSDVFSFMFTGDDYTILSDRDSTIQVHPVQCPVVPIVGNILLPSFVTNVRILNPSYRCYYTGAATQVGLTLVAVRTNGTLPPWVVNLSSMVTVNSVAQGVVGQFTNTCPIPAGTRLAVQARAVAGNPSLSGLDIL